MNLSERPSGLLDDFYRPFGSLFKHPLTSRLMADPDGWLPSVDIKQEDDAYTIQMDVPGFTAEQVQVEAHDNVLTIQGSRESSSEEEQDSYVRRERQYGQFVRRFSLPPGSRAEDISAQVKDGVLNVRIPAEETRSPKRITVE